MIASIRRTSLRRRAGLGCSGRLFGIGLSRTGTTSLTTALTALGFRAVHFPADRVTQAAITACLGSSCPHLRLELLTRVDALIDSPVAATFEALDSAYRRSKFIYTVRERDSWLDSCRWYWTEGVEPFISERRNDPWTRYIEAVNRSLYFGSTFEVGRFARAYDVHDARVRAHFRERQDDLLELDISGGEGWPELCSFLRLPVPDAPFPWEHGAE